MTSGKSRFADRLTERLLRLDLGDPGKVTLAASLISGGVRLVYLPLYAHLGLHGLGVQSALALVLYLVLIAIRGRPNHHNLVLLVWGPEWILWSYANTVAFGGDCSFQLYPLLLLPAFVLPFHLLGPGLRLALMAAPLALYVPFYMLFGTTRPVVELAEITRSRIAVANEVVVAVTVMLFAGAALLEHWRARRLAEDREVVQAQLVEDLAHELRTPLATLLTAAQGALAARHRPERVTESLEWIEDASRSASRLVDRLLDLAALEGGMPPADPAEIGGIVRGVVKRLGPVAENRGIVLRLREMSACRERVDAVSLEIVVQNLVANAIAHSPRGERVEIRIRHDLGHPRIEIEDRGEGIAPEHLPRIFDRLWRADAARSRDEGRYGLGLAIARRHAELLGARIEVASETGRGSIFSVVWDGAPRRPLPGPASPLEPR